MTHRRDLSRFNLSHQYMCQLVMCPAQLQEGNEFQPFSRHSGALFSLPTITDTIFSKLKIMDSGLPIPTAQKIIEVIQMLYIYCFYQYCVKIIGGNILYNVAGWKLKLDSMQLEHWVWEKS